MSTRHALVPRCRNVVAVVVAAVIVTAVLAGCGHASGSAPDAARSAPAATSSAETPAAGDPTSGGATPSSATTATGGDPCSLLSVQEASSLTGQTFVSSEPETLGTARTCTYAPGGDTTQQLIVSVERSASCWSAVESDGVQHQSVPGVGDAAYGYGTGLDVKHGSGTCIEITGDSRAESTGDWSADVAVAQAVITGLG